MSAAIIIPARYASSRFPGKPLCMIAGRTMLQRVWQIASSVKGAARVLIATEDSRIVEHARSFGAEACITPDTCRNGTERALSAIAVAGVEQEVIVNLQGDAVLTPPWVLEALISEFARDPSIELATPAVVMTDQQLTEFIAHKQTSPSSGTTVVCDTRNDALYFSKQVIPFRRSGGVAPVRRHIGLYGYRVGGLRRWVDLAETPLERTEGLEQLRPLEHGMKIRVVDVDYRGRTHWSIDSPADAVEAEALIAREGELL